MAKVFLSLVIGIGAILIIGYLAIFVLFAAVDTAKRNRD